MYTKLLKESREYSPIELREEFWKASYWNPEENAEEFLKERRRNLCLVPEEIPERIQDKYLQECRGIL